MNIELPSNLKLMSLGTDCLLMKAFSDCIHGPLDDIGVNGPECFYALKDKTFLKKFLKGKYTLCKSANPGLSETEFYLNDLKILITHEDYTDDKVKQNYIKLINNFYDFYSHINEDDHYFMLYVRYNFSEKDAIDFRNALEDLGILDKTIVFANKDYSEIFPKFIFLGDLDLRNMPRSKDILLSARVFIKNLIVLRNLLKEKGYATVSSDIKID